ncbi:hypothetical protein AgCh_008963 [Apium graveolens]
MSGNEIPQEGAHQQEEAKKQTAGEIHVDLEDGEHIDKAEQQGGKYENKGKRGSKAWDYFDEIKGCPKGFEKSKCKFCDVVIGSNTNKNETSAMMNHLKTVCAKSPLRTNLDKLQRTLKLEKLSADENSQTLKAHTFNQEKLKKKLILMCIKDNQPFRVVEHEGLEN